MVLKTAAECTVLLKTDGKFPLDAPCEIDGFGAGMRYTIKGGTGSGEVNSRITYQYWNGECRQVMEISLMFYKIQIAKVKDLVWLRRRKVKM